MYTLYTIQRINWKGFVALSYIIYMNEVVGNILVKLLKSSCLIQCQDFSAIITKNIKKKIFQTGGCGVHHALEECQGGQRSDSRTGDLLV